MRKKKFDRVRFLIATGVSGIAWIVGLLSLDTRSFYVDSNGYAIPMYPHPLLVMVITIIVMGVSAYMWRWYRMDRVQQALSTLNHDERQQLLLKLAQQTASDRLTLNEEGELNEVPKESAIEYKRKNAQHTAQGAD